MPPEGWRQPQGDEDGRQTTPADGNGRRTPKRHRMRKRGRKKIAFLRRSLKAGSRQWNRSSGPRGKNRKCFFPAGINMSRAESEFVPSMQCASYGAGFHNRTVDVAYNVSRMGAWGRISSFVGILINSLAGKIDNSFNTSCLYLLSVFSRQSVNKRYREVSYI